MKPFRAFFLVSLAVLCGLYIYGRSVKTAGEPPGLAGTPAPAFAQATFETEIITVPAPVSTPPHTAAAVPTPTVEPTPFSFVWISDTQVYAYKFPAVFRAMTQWAVDEKETHNILAVLHTGDIVDNHTLPGHWQKADSAICLLAPGIPFYCVAGNHDVGMTQPDYANYLFYDFNNARQPLFAGGACWAQPLSAGGTDFLLLGIGWRPPDGWLDWAKTVLDAHPDHVAILLTHSFLTGEGELTREGRLLEREILAAFPSVRLVLCGHNRGSARWEKTYENGRRRVHALMYNFQDDEVRGLGYLRILMCNPLTRNIALTTYSPWLDRFNYQRDADLDTFTLRNAF